MYIQNIILNGGKSDLCEKPYVHSFSFHIIHKLSVCGV